MDDYFRSVDGEGDGGGCASAGGDGGHGDDLGGDFALGEESFEGGDDLVLHGAVGGHGADEERDAGVEGSGELGGLPPDEVGELGGEYVFCRHGLKVEDEAGGCGLEADVGEEAGVADALGGCLDCGGSGGGSGFEAADGEEVGLGVGRGSSGGLILGRMMDWAGSWSAGANRQRRSTSSGAREMRMISAP